MKRNRQQSIFLSILIILVLIVGSIGASLFYQIPSLQTSHQELENSRITLSILERQVASSKNVDAQIKELEDTETELLQHVWAFTNEESFFTRWDAFGQANGVTIEVDDVADVVPSDQPIVRSARLVFRGAYRNILNALSNLQKIDPVLSIQEVVLQPDPESANMIAQVTLESVWQ